jgi:hypothetical protein
MYILGAESNPNQQYLRLRFETHTSYHQIEMNENIDISPKEERRAGII